MNTYIIQQVVPIHRQPNQNTPIPGEDENISENVGLYEDEESTLEEQNIEVDHRNFRSESLDTRSYAKDGLLGRISQAELFGSESSSFLRKVRFCDQKFATSTFVSNIKYNHPRF